MACKHALTKLYEDECPQIGRYRRLDWCGRCGVVVQKLIRDGVGQDTIYTPRITKIVKKWVKKNNVLAPECLVQVDKVNEDLPELGLKLLEVAGCLRPKS